LFNTSWSGSEVPEYFVGPDETIEIFGVTASRIPVRVEVLLP